MPDLSYHEYLCCLAREHEVERYLEVGGYLGSTLIGVKLAFPDMEVALIDDFQLSSPEAILSNAKELGAEIDPDFIFSGKDLDLLPHCIDTFRPHMLHLDADHSTLGVYNELVASAGYPTGWDVEVVVLHDAIDPTVRRGFKDFCHHYQISTRYHIAENPAVFNGCFILTLRD
jgi:hypothetical protein